MKTRNRELRKSASLETPARSRWWVYPLILFATLYIVLQVYSPVLYGPFLFDDDYLGFRAANPSPELRAWIVGLRPLLMGSYWINFRLSGMETFSYHLFNVVFHAVNGCLIFLIVRRLLELAGVGQWRRTLVAAFGGALFLLHPVQTESVAYIASRSENLSVMFFLGAFAVFVLRRRPAVSWPVAAGVLALFGAAVTTKEHTLMLAPLLLLTDYWWNPGFSFEGLRRNWRLYLPLALGALAGVKFIWPILFGSNSAGFGLKDFTWYQYFFTECRALFVYLRLFVLPAGQTVDYDFPISRTVLEHGAVVGLVVLAGLTVAAWIYRRRFPLACYGWLAFLILMAPTSSFMPIQDPVAERRLYLSMIGLILILAEFLRRVKVDDRRLGALLAVVLVVFGGLAWHRNHVWGDRLSLWEDTVRESPNKTRGHFQLAYGYFELGRCAEAVSEYGVVARLQPPTHELLVDWALAYDCLNQADEAVAKLKQAAALRQTAHVYAMIAMVYAKRARLAEALDALDTAQKVDPNYAMTYYYRGGVRLAQNRGADALAEYRHAQALDPENQTVGKALATAENRLHTGR